MTHTSWAKIKRRRASEPGVKVGYLDARAQHELADRIRRLREARGVSQRDLAALIGTTQSVISRLESGGSKPSLSTLARIGAALDAELVIDFADARTAVSERPTRYATKRRTTAPKTRRSR